MDSKDRKVKNEAVQRMETALSEIAKQRIKKPSNIYRKGFTDGLAAAWITLYAEKRKFEDGDSSE